MIQMAKRLQTNDLNRRITLQVKEVKRDEANFPVPNEHEWTDVVTVWAFREPMRGREFLAAEADHAELTVRYKIWYREGITEDMRLYDKKDKRTYEIKVVLDDVFDDRTETHIMAAVTSNA